MSSDNRLFDDLAKMAGGAASLLSTVRRQVSSDIKERAHSYSSRINPTDNSEIERLQAIVSKYRLEQEQMKKRIADLEALVSGKTKTAPKKQTIKASKRK